MYKYLAELTRADEIEGFDRRLQKIHEDLMSKGLCDPALDGVGQEFYSLNWFKGALWADPDIGKAHLQSLMRHPSALLLLEDEVCEALGLDGLDSIEQALGIVETSNHPAKSTVVEAWRRYVIEQRWAKLRGIAEDGRYPLDRALGEVTHTTFEVMDMRFKELLLTDLPMAPRDLRRLIRSLQKLFPNRTLSRIGDVPVTDRSIKCIRGVGQITLDRFRCALLECAFIWRWHVAGLERIHYAEPIPLLERQIYFEENLDSGSSILR